MKKLVIAAAIAVFPAVAGAQPALLEVKTETLVTMGSEARANFSVNNTSGRVLPMVFVDCTFFDGEQKPFKTQVAIVNNVAVGQKAHGSATVVNPKVIRSAECRFSKASG